MAPASAANPGGHVQTALSNAPGNPCLPSLVSENARLDKALTFTRAEPGLSEVSNFVPIQRIPSASRTDGDLKRRVDYDFSHFRETKYSPRIRSVCDRMPVSFFGAGP